MASIGKRRGRFTVRFTSVDGTRHDLYGFTSERFAHRTGDKIDDLVAARKMGTIPEDLKKWLSQLVPDIHEKLAEWGLCDPPEKSGRSKN